MPFGQSVPPIPRGTHLRAILAKLVATVNVVRRNILFPEMASLASQQLASDCSIRAAQFGLLNSGLLCSN